MRVAAILVFLAGASTLASAQEAAPTAADAATRDSRRAEGKRHFEQGLALYQDNNFGGAKAWKNLDRDRYNTFGYKSD